MHANSGCSLGTGVIWKGDSVIDGVPETLDMLRKLVRACICVCACVCVCAYMCVCVCVCVWSGVPLMLSRSCTQQGKKLFFVTNNSTKSRAGYLKKFTSLGLENISAEEVRFSISVKEPAYRDHVRPCLSGHKESVLKSYRRVP
jgi:phosphoglycolate phosphatase